MDSPIRDWPLALEIGFGGRLRLAIQDGILWGVKLALAVGFVLLGVSYLLNDYNVVRQRSLNGQRAFEFLQQQQPLKPVP